MPQATSNTDSLDDHVLEVVCALHGAVKQGIAHTNDPKIVDKAIADCKEILDEVMTGQVNEWLN